MPLQQSTSSFYASVFMQKNATGVALFVFGLVMFCAGSVGVFVDSPILFSLLSIGVATVGGLLVATSAFGGLAGVKNDGTMFASSKNRGAVGWLMGIVLTLFYVLLYWFPDTLQYMVQAADPVSYTLRGMPADRWFFYGLLYTIAILVMGLRFIGRNRHNRYQIIRTLSVMAFQTVFAFAIPAVLEALQKPYFDFKNVWPLDYDFFYSWHLNKLTSESTPFFAGLTLGEFMLYWGIAMIVIGIPVLTYFFGKRWYCSWVCGCGGLAETVGDPYRHLSDKSMTSWKIERWMIYSVLVLVTVMTVLVILEYVNPAEYSFAFSRSLRTFYGFAIGAAFSGVIGVGFYPIMGSRVWCRFGCPMAAILGLFQRKASRFRITVNGDQCMSCGNCSTYCEMGIDVRAYAQKGEDFTRASCVGCGICSSVCPRGVLKLENDSVATAPHNKTDR